MEKEVKNFLISFIQMNREEKIESLKVKNISFLEMVCLYADISNMPYIRKEINELTSLINDEIRRQAFINDEKSRIEFFRSEIERILANSEEDEDYYKFSAEEKMILDGFFSKSSDRVIENILEGIRNRLLGKTKHIRRRKDHFDVTSSVVIFPNSHHSNLELNYLEDCYRKKIKMLKLDEIGIIDLKIIPSQKIEKDNFYLIDYSNEKFNKKSRYLSFNYSLDAACDMEKAKGFVKKKTYNEVKKED